ncbi:hypothetical protein [Mycobacterium asiaticum]|uniref:hypothetical protein n=1 Tax=Mycobacterium asiaticum TaxID=1790 RepID=UPI000A56C8DC|nr:hypothetical protein [Mycobacterium asiaticum]
MDSHPDRDKDLADVVDNLQEAVTEERRDDDVPGNADEREQAPVEGSTHEPPD